MPAAHVPPRARPAAEADELIDFLGLGRYADAYISDLSTGTRRIVELAGLLALDAEVLCLDEPTAGLAQRETEAFGPLIQEIRRELDASVLVIEHDMPLIMGISDRVVLPRPRPGHRRGRARRGPQRPRRRSPATSAPTNAPSPAAARPPSPPSPPPRPDPPPAAMSERTA